MIGDNDMTERYVELMEDMSNAIEQAAPQIARSQRAVFEALKEEGFSEEQALELTKDITIEAE